MIQHGSHTNHLMQGNLVLMEEKLLKHAAWLCLFMH